MTSDPTSAPIGKRNISTTYQIAYETLDGNAQVRRIGDRLWEILSRGKATVYEKSMLYPVSTHCGTF